MKRFADEIREDDFADWSKIPPDLRQVIVKMAVMAQTVSRLGRVGWWIIGATAVVMGLIYAALASANQALDLHNKLHH